MKLSSREKILLIALAMAGFLAAYYYLLLSPQLLALETIKATAAEYKLKVEEMKAQMDPNHPIYAEFKTKQTELTNKTAKLYPAILQDKLITVLDEKFKATGLNPKEVTFEKTLRTAGTAKSAGTAKKAGDAKTPDLPALRQSYVSVGKPKDTAANQEIPEIFRMHELTANFNIEAEYQKLMNLIAAFEKDKYKIILNNISMGTDEGTAFSGSFSVSFISVPKLFEDGDKDYLDWLLKYNSNKYNPFAASANLNPGETAPKPVVETPVPEPTPTPTPTPKPTTPTPAPPAPSKTSDFAITLRPISSDIPTVLVGKVNDKGAGAYVYADNTNFENVEMQILEKDGKLYYRYKTTSDSYPSDYSEMTVFTPKSTGIIIEVLSTKRTGSDDKSGINLTVINKSNKKVTVSIKNDDTSRSRVKVSSTSGSVTVRR
jgi:type IV pilus assembly protein PilO